MISNLKKYLLAASSGLLTVAFLVNTTGCATKGIYGQNLGGASGVLVSGEVDSNGGFNDATPKKVTYSRKDFVVSDLKSKVMSNGLRKLQLDVANVSSQYVNLEYRIFWYDQQGMEIQPDSPVSSWQALQLFSKGVRSITSVSPNEQAYSFKVYLRKITYKR